MSIEELMEEIKNVLEKEKKELENRVEELKEKVDDNDRKERIRQTNETIIEAIKLIKYKIEVECWKCKRNNNTYYDNIKNEWGYIPHCLYCKIESKEIHIILK